MTKHKTILAFYWLLGISIFLLPLVHAWLAYPLGIESFFTSYSALGGVIPYSDAGGYYGGAINLLENGFLNSWNMRRPLNASLFSVRLWLTNNNFYLALIVQAIWCSISCLLVTASINKSFGKKPSILTLLILFLFASIFIPTTMSETLGLTLGCLSFVILLEAINSNRWWLFTTAGLMLTIGLNTRAGAFLILPFLTIWLHFAFKNNIKTINFILGIIGGFFCNIILIKLYGLNNSGAMHANFADTVFGLVSGGKGWDYFYSLYPEKINNIQSEANYAKLVYSESFKVFKNNPFLLLKGLLRGYLGVIKGFTSFFQYWVIISNNIILKIIVRCFGFVVLFLGVYRLYYFNKFYNYNIHIKNKFNLIQISLISMFLSAGIIWTDGGIRVFAVTVPFFAAIFGILAEKPPKANYIQNNNIISWETKFAIVFSYILLILGLIGPILIKFFTNKSKLKIQFHCPLNTTKLIVKNIYGSPRVELPLYAKRLENNLIKNSLIENKYMLKLLKSSIVTRPMFLALVYDSNNITSKHILGSKEIFSYNNACVGLCAAPIPGIEDIMQIQSFKVLNNKASDEQ